MKIQLEVQAEKCPYWNYENQTCRHTCKGCEELPKGNTIETIQCGVMIDGNRYCMLDVDIYGEILKSVIDEKVCKEFNLPPEQLKKAEQDFAEQLEKFKEAWKGVAQAIVDGLNGKHTPTVKEKPKVDKCEGCVYRGEYQDMGATTPICNKGIDLAEAVNMRNDPNPCKYNTTWREIDEYVKRREGNNGT